jgi:hypothetical protein
MKKLNIFLNECLVNEAKLTPEHQLIIDNLYNKITSKFEGTEYVKEVTQNISGSGKQSSIFVDFYNDKGFKKGEELKIRGLIKYERGKLIIVAPYIKLTRDVNILTSFSVKDIYSDWKPSFKTGRNFEFTTNDFDKVIEAFEHIREFIKDRYVMSLFNEVVSDKYRNMAIDNLQKMTKSQADDENWIGKYTQDYIKQGFSKDKKLQKLLDNIF